MIKFLPLIGCWQKKFLLDVIHVRQYAISTLVYFVTWYPDRWGKVVRRTHDLDSSLTSLLARSVWQKPEIYTVLV